MFVLDSAQSKTARRETARPGESATPGSLPASLKGRDQEGEDSGERAKATSLERRAEGDPSGLVWAGPRSSLA